MPASDSLPEPGSRAPMQAQVRRLPVYPILLAVAFLLAAYLQADVSVLAILRALAASVLIALVLLLVGAFLTRSLLWGGAVASAGIVLLHAGDLLHAIEAGLLVGLTLLAAWYWARLRKGSALDGGTRVLNILTAALCVVLIGQAIVVGMPSRIAVELGVSKAYAAERTKAADLPDIYVLMLEDYPRADTLRRLLGFDNRAFLTDLARRGFAVSTGASAAYQHTDLNLATLFQMQYVTALPAVKDYQAGRSSAPSAGPFITANPVLTELKAAGYTTYSAVSRWESEAFRGVDVFCGAEQVNEFEYQVFGSSLAGWAMDQMLPAWRVARDRSLIQRQLDCATAAADASVSGPRFVFAHIDAPHPPVVFDAAGDAASPSVYWLYGPDAAAGSTTFTKAYLQQLQWMNQEALHILDAFDRSTGRRSVVLLMSDEGFDNEGGGTARDRFSALFAARTPGHARLFASDQLMVNVFPTLLNAYLGTEYPKRTPRYFESAPAAEDKPSVDVTEVPSPFGVP